MGFLLCRMGCKGHDCPVICNAGRENMADDLASYLERYDGADTTPLNAAFASFGSDDGFIADLIALCQSENATVVEGASWLLKHALERKAVVAPPLVNRVIGALPDLPTWQVKLHFAQSLPYLDIPDTKAKKVFEWTKGLADHPRPFLRAWGLNALVHLAEQHPAYAASAAEARAQAEGDKAASVRARARNLRGG